METKTKLKEEKTTFREGIQFKHYSTAFT